VWKSKKEAVAFATSQLSRDNVQALEKNGHAKLPQQKQNTLGLQSDTWKG